MEKVLLGVWCAIGIIISPLWLYMYLPSNSIEENAIFSIMEVLRLIRWIVLVLLPVTFFLYKAHKEGRKYFWMAVIGLALCVLLGFLLLHLFPWILGFFVQSILSKY